jgi:hypothetical protein
MSPHKNHVAFSPGIDQPVLATVFSNRKQQAISYSKKFGGHTEP